MLNRVTLIGRITKKPILNSVSNDTKICTFTIALNKGFSKNAGTDFVLCKAFNKTAETLEKYVDKGSLLLAEGRINTSSYTKDNKRIFNQDIIITTIRFLETKKESINSEHGMDKETSDMYKSFKSSFETSGDSTEDEFKFDESKQDNVNWEF